MPDIVDMLQALPHDVTPGPAGPDLAAADVARGHRALVRRRRRRLTGVAGTVAAGAAAVVLVVTSTSAPGHDATASAQTGVSGHPGGRAAGGAPAHTFPGTPSAVELRASLTAALTKAVATSKLTVRSTFNGYPSVTVTVPSQNWQLETDMYPNGATMQVKFTTVEPGTGAYAGVLGEKTLVFDYGRREAITRVLYALDPKRITDATPWYGDGQPESLGSSSWSKVTGTATVDGQPAYVLAQTGSGGYRSTVWVSKETLLPIKDVVHTYVGTTYDTYIWSAASGPSATAAANAPAIPAGFTRIGPDSACPTPQQARQDKSTEWGC
jgi:hypothetical protein